MACYAHLQRMFEQQYRFVAPALLPIGDFVAQISELSGTPPAELLVLTRGSAPVSAGAEDGREQLGKAIRDDAEAAAILGSDDPPVEILTALRARPGATGAATNAYLERVECRLVDGFEVGCPCGFELPEVLVRAIRCGVEGPDREQDVSEETERVRERVPSSERRRFDELLAEARLTSRLRDERSIYSSIWAMGLMRRAILAAGERFAAEERIEEPAHLLDASYDEIVSMLRGGEGPVRGRARSAGPLPGHVHGRRGAAGAGRSPAAAAATRATARRRRPDDARHDHGRWPAVHRLRGGKRSPARARSAREPRDLRRHGARAPRAGGVRAASPGRRARHTRTSEAFTVVLPLLGALVTDHGGLLAHAAIVSREFEIPGVVGHGTRPASSRMAPGCEWTAFPAWFSYSHDRELYGGAAQRGPGRIRVRRQAVQLGAAIRAGLPVPDGVALPATLVAAAASGECAAASELRSVRDSLCGPLAVRSSCVGEDSAAASFAGQHLTRLNVRSLDELVTAVAAVWRSGHSISALAYRRKLGIEDDPRMGVVVQRLLDPQVSGVLFTRHPVTGADERVIEATWGLGEAVVQGLVTPDRYRLSLAGEVLERSPGRKHVAIRARPDALPAAEPVAAHLVDALCLDDRWLARLHSLACRCEKAFQTPSDIEWAFADADLHLLQRRVITNAVR